MTYNEWRDELKSNLLCVSDSERRRVLDYYAEAYADRRDAGYTEREIIDDFGAPYDAAQRILAENSYNYYDEPQPARSARDERREERERRREERREEKCERNASQNNYGDVNGGTYYSQHQYNAPSPSPQPANRREDYTWVFVLLCIIFAVPIFCVVMTMVGITVGFCVAPFGVLVGGVATFGTGIGMLFVEPVTGAAGIGVGLIIFGLSLIMMPLCFKLVKWMWKLFTMFFAWLKRLFSGKEKVR